MENTVNVILNSKTGETVFETEFDVNMIADYGIIEYKDCFYVYDPRASGGDTLMYVETEVLKHLA